MALKKFYINDDMSKLADIIDNLGYYDTVTYEVDGSNSTITCKINNQTALYIYKNQPGSAPYYTIKAYNENGDYITISDGNSSSNLYYVYSCTNGILIGPNYSTSSYIRILITKTNNNVPVVIGMFSYMQYSGIKIIAWDDVTPFRDFAYTNPNTTYYPTTTIVPFTTNSDIDYLSYTPNAGYIIQHPVFYNGWHKLVIGNDIYLCDGFWVIKD